MHIYYIKNKLNKKVYIGQTNHLKRRWARHKNELRHNKHTNEHLQRSWNKYGENLFEFLVLETCFDALADEREKYWIKYYDSSNPKRGFNLDDGGQNGKITNEGRRKLSIANSGRKLTEQHKLKISKGNKGKIISKECREKISKALKILYANGVLKAKLPKVKRGMEHPMWGKKHTEESREKIKIARTGKTYEEIFGDAKASEMRERRKIHWKRENNPEYKNIDMDLVSRRILNGEMVKDLLTEYNISRPGFYKKFYNEIGISVPEFRLMNNISIPKRIYNKEYIENRRKIMKGKKFKNISLDIELKICELAKTESIRGITRIIKQLFKIEISDYITVRTLKNNGLK